MPDSHLGTGPQESHQIQIRAIVFREGDVWVAQCIEHDIRAKAQTLTDLNKKLELIVRLECEESIKRAGRPFAGIPRAPIDFEEMWNKQSGAFTPAHAGPAPVGSRVKDRIDLELALCA